MACRTPAEITNDTPNSIQINKKIVELKKKIVLAGEFAYTFKNINK